MMIVAQYIPSINQNIKTAGKYMGIKGGVS
jgi:hypothetical protein